MALSLVRPSGEFHASYRQDTTVFPSINSRRATIAGIVLLALMPLFAGNYVLNLLIQIGYIGIAALGLNILVGFTGQISIGHSVFFGFGAFASAYFNHRFGIPVFFSIPLAGLATTAVGLVFGLPAARLKGLYLAIATLAAQFILQDFFARAHWFTGGVSGTAASPFSILGFTADNDVTYFYVVLVYVVVCFLLVTNLMRSRDGRALIAVRDHYLSAEMMGVNLTAYRTMSFGISSFYAGIGGALYAHYLGFVSTEGFDIFFSIQFLAIVIIGGLGSMAGALVGGVLIGVSEALAGFLVAPSMKSMFSFALLIAVLVLRPQGLLGKKRA